ncbi:CID domain-containing protein, partial [Nephila pilipes]
PKNFINSLKKLKNVESEIKEKEEILKYAEVPELPDLNELMEPTECLEIGKKINSYYSMLQQCLKMASQEVTARKNILKELKNSCIFYTAQYGDVKKVANAYFMYGKKLKIMEKKLSEKKSSLPSPVINNSPSFSEGMKSASPILALSPTDNFSTSKTFTRVSLSPSYKKDQVSLHGTSFSGKIPKTDFSKNFEEIEEGSKKSEQAPKQKFNKLAELFSEPKSCSNKLKEYNSSELLKNNTCKEKPTSSPQADLEARSICQQNNNISELNSTNVTNQQKETLKNKLQHSFHKELDTPNQRLENISDEVKKCNPIKSTGNITVGEGYVNEIDFLLEESYDSKKVKSNKSIKRKIELLLNSKGKKICTDASSEHISDSKSPVNVQTSVKNSSLKELSENITDHEKNLICNLEEINQKENITSHIVISENALDPKQEEELLLHSTQMEGNIMNGGNNNFPIDKNVSNLNSNIQNVIRKEINVDNCITDFSLKSEDSMQPKDTESMIKFNDSFLSSSLLSSVSSLSTEFLKNIFKKTNSNLSSDIENNNTVKKPLLEECKINPTSQSDTGSSFNNLKQSANLLENSDSKDDIKTTPLEGIKEVCSSEETSTYVDTVIKSLSQTEVHENLIKTVVDIQEDGKTGDTKIISCDKLLTDSNDPEPVKGCNLKIQFSGDKSEDDNENSASKGDSLLQSNDQPIISATNEKPNLLFTLRNILHSIAEKKLSNIDPQNCVQGTPMSFEDCLKIYHALNNNDSKVSNDTNSLNTQLTLTSTKTSAANRASSDFSNQDNLEVMDMECDSDE